MAGLYYAVAAILVGLWLYSFFVARMTGPVIHVLLVGAVVIAVYQWLDRRRSV